MDSKIVPFQQLRESTSQEIADRTKAHQAKIGRIKTAISTRTPLAAPAPAQPLVMLAHGDSWLDYPLDGNSPSFSHSDVTVQLQSMGNINPQILNLSQWGDATTAEMCLPKQQKMITALGDPSNWITGLPDAILFWGGGNDIAGDQFCIFLDYAGTSPTGLDATRFQKALGIVEASYQDLFAFRDRYAPGVLIFGHCYEGKGACPNVGPWLQPSLVFLRV